MDARTALFGLVISIFHEPDAEVQLVDGENWLTVEVSLGDEKGSIVVGNKILEMVSSGEAALSKWLRSQRLIVEALRREMGPRCAPPATC